MHFELLNQDVLTRKGPWLVGFKGSGIWIPVSPEFINEDMARDYCEQLQALYDAYVQKIQAADAVKQVDAKGRIALGQKFAGKRVQITETTEGCKIDVVEVVKQP
jgi:hypothetical protein